LNPFSKTISGFLFWLTLVCLTASHSKMSPKATTSRLKEHTLHSKRGWTPFSY